MKSEIKFFKDVPVNILIIPVLFVFLFQAFLAMFYNNNELTFYSIHSFHSLAKAEAIADFNWTNFGRIPGLKEINGFLYPVIVSLFIKLIGKYNIIPILYVISFFVFLFISIIFYKIAKHFLNNRYSIITTIIFIISAPVMLSILSGADIMLINLLFILNVYYIYFNSSKKDYKIPVILSILLLFTTYIGMIYGLISIFYIVLSINEKKLKDNYIKNMLLILSCFFVFCILFCGYIFIDEISPSFIQKNVLTNTKTFFVDSFFKDGFLWSKLLPPFFSIFFFISICMRYMNEIKEKKVSFVTFILLNSIAAFIMEFFAIFSVNTDTFLFISPFLFFLILSGIDGIFYIIELIQIKNTIFSKSNIILGLILFIILYNMFWTFTVAVEKNNNIRAQHSNMYVERFFEK